MADQVQEVVTALTIETGKSYASIAELREAVRGLREQLKQTAFEDENFDKVQKELAATQEALTQVTKMSTAAQAENWEGVDLGTKSYNELTKQMKALNAEWRATTDEVQRQQLGSQIMKINDRLKELDASTGNFQRNVGDYANGVKKGLDAFTKGVGNAIPGLNNFKLAADGISKSPFIAIIGLLVQLFASLINRMKETEEGQASLNKIMSAFNKILEPIRAVVGWIADALGRLFDWLAPAIGQVVTWLGKLSAKLAGVGNAILQYILAPIRSAIAVIKGVAKIIGDIFTGKWSKVKEDAKGIGQGVGEAWKKGFDFKANYETGKAAGERVIAGIASRRNQKKAEEAGKTVGAAVAKGVEESFAQQVDKALAAGLNKIQDLQKLREQAEKESAAMSEAMWKEDQEAIEEDLAVQEAALDRKIELWNAEQQAKRDMVSATAQLFGDMADALEADKASAEKHAGMIKALRAAETIINTISGAMGAFMGITKDTGGWGIALAAVQAASIMATGYANVRKILATDTGTGSTASGISAATPTTPAFVAPQVDYSPQTVSTATGAQEIERLNAGRGDQRVYVVYSDIANAGKQVEVTQAESSFK